MQNFLRGAGGKAVSTLTVLSMLAGCATVDTSTRPSTGADVLKKEVDFRTAYLHNRDTLTMTEYMFDIPLIGAAAGAVGVLAFAKGTGRTNALTGIGLGAGLATAYRTYLDPSDGATAYQDAADTLDCMIDASSRLLTNPDTTDMQSLHAALGTTQRDINSATVLLASPAANTDALKTDRDNLNQALTAAKAALTAGQQEYAAYLTVNEDVNYAIDQVDSKLFKRIQKKPVSYADQLQSINSIVQSTINLNSAVNTAKQNAVTAPKGGAPPAAGSVQEQLEDAAGALSTDALGITTLIANAGYAAMSTAVKACVSQFGSS